MIQLLNKHISQDAQKGIFCFALFRQVERNVRLGNLRLVIHHVRHGSTPAITPASPYSHTEALGLIT